MVLLSTSIATTDFKVYCLLATPGWDTDERKVLGCATLPLLRVRSASAGEARRNHAEVGGVATALNAARAACGVAGLGI